MKANELSCRDLMVGDWVRIKITQHNTTVTNIDANSVYTEAAFPIRYDEIEPIPLTSEILEKNGFKPYIPEGHLETVYACQDISKAVANELYALWPHQDGSFYLLLRVDGKDVVRMDVHYIHKLQHALKLCEIKKTIEL